MRKPQKLNSELIAAYVKASQQIENDLERERLSKIDGIVQTRKKPEKKKKQKVEKKQGNLADIDYHRLDRKILFSETLKVPQNILEIGLTDEQVKEKQDQYGLNVLTEKTTVPWYMKLIHEWTSPFALMLWAGAALCFLAYFLDSSDASNLYLGIVLTGVVMLTGIVTFFQNAKSESLMAGFKDFIPPKCKCLRNGKYDELPAKQLVPGDVVKIKDGDQVPADIRIFLSNEMTVDNSSLTGESDPLLRKVECDQPQKILETSNVAFFGTLCKAGNGMGIVCKTGDDTVIGQIAGMADSAEIDLTPLRKELNAFIKMITIIALTLGAVFFLGGFILGYSIIQNLVFAIGIIVANVPEGLLATITVSLSVAAMRLSRKFVLVKNLESVETLGSTNCICSDKTGTLTQNKMTIKHIFYDLNIYHADSIETKKAPGFQYQYNKDSIGFNVLKECAVVNCVAEFSSALPDKKQMEIDSLKKEDPRYEANKKKVETEWAKELASLPYYKRPVNGDASETGIVKFFQPFEDILKIRARHNLGTQKNGSPAVVPFNSAHKFALKVVEEPIDGSHWVVYLKGASERVWDKCAFALVNGENIPFTKREMDIVTKAQIFFAKGGERILGFAKYHLPIDKYPKNHQFDFKGAYDLDIPMDQFSLIGLMSLEDPPREAVPGAIAKCKTAGIKVIMVTGDHQLTAASIARQIGIFEQDVKTSIQLHEELGISMEEAIDRAEAIVINGDMLTLAAKEDEGLPDNQKGKKLERWLKKEQIVFARTSPAQKLYIVSGCQGLDYTVAVTGDGVNDSPAIKKADIGIAMGIAGTDVTKDSADMILLNDDFSAIILGIEEGRKIFDNLKKSIAYTLTSNIPEIIPFIVFIVFQVPLPLSTVLILCVDLGTDIFPAVSFAYEDPELDIMTRRPRKKYDHLVSGKLLVFAYLQMGVIQTCGGFVCYFMVMNDFGFPPASLLYTILKPYFEHNHYDVYNPNVPFFGNTNIKCENGALQFINKDVVNGEADSGGISLDWLFMNHGQQDLRMGMLEEKCTETAPFVKHSIEFGECLLHQISPITMRPVCFSTEALKYAQTSFFFSIVITQFSNCKSPANPSSIMQESQAVSEVPRSEKLLYDIRVVFRGIPLVRVGLHQDSERDLRYP